VGRLFCIIREKVSLCMNVLVQLMRIRVAQTIGPRWMTFAKIGNRSTLSIFECTEADFRAGYREKLLHDGQHNVLQLDTITASIRRRVLMLNDTVP